MTLHLLFSSSLPLTLNIHSDYKVCNNNLFCATYPLKQHKKSYYHHSRCTASNETASSSESSSSSSSLDGRFLSDVSTEKDANQVLDMIAKKSNKISGTLSTSDSALIIAAALQRQNADLALSVFSSMRSTFDPVGGGEVISRWRWPRPDLRTYTLLVQGLAASLRVSDALKIIEYVCRVGSSPSQEVSFGKVIKCPTCKVAVAVAQPQ